MKKILTPLLAAWVLLFLASCSFDVPSVSSEISHGEDASSGEKVVLRLANSHNAEHITSQACQMFADLGGGADRRPYHHRVSF